jgi:hypothetical protein
VRCRARGELARGPTSSLRRRSGAMLSSLGSSRAGSATDSPQTAPRGGAGRDAGPGRRAGAGRGAGPGPPGRGRTGRTGRSVVVTRIAGPLLRSGPGPVTAAMAQRRCPGDNALPSMRLGPVRRTAATGHRCCRCRRYGRYGRREPGMARNKLAPPRTLLGPGRAGHPRARPACPPQPPSPTNAGKPAHVVPA